jgi:hypothetical protein
MLCRSFNMSILGSPRIWAAVVSFAAAQPALAAVPASVFPDLRAPQVVRPLAAGAETIISTFIHNTLNTGITESAGTFVQIDSQTLTCPAAPGTCTVSVAANVEASGGANASNNWAICVLVDGVYADSCPYQGELLADSSYSTGYELQSVSVPKGKHTLSVQVFSFDGLTLGYYTIQYSNYKP